MGWVLVVRFDLGPLLQGQMRIVKGKSAYNSLIVVARGLGCEANLWAGNLFVWSDLTLGPSFKVKRVEPNLKVLIARFSLLIGWES